MNCVSHFRGNCLPFTVVQCHLQASYYGKRSGYVWLLYYRCSVTLTTFILPWLHLRFSLSYNNSNCGESFSVFFMTDMLRENPHIFFSSCASLIYWKCWKQPSRETEESRATLHLHLCTGPHSTFPFISPTFSTFFWLHIVKRTDQTSDFVNNHYDQKISQYWHYHILNTKYKEINNNNVKFILSIACDVCYLLLLFHFHY